MNEEPRDGIQISWSPGSRPGQIEVLVRFAGGNTFTNVVNIANANARDKYLDRLLQNFPALDRADVARMLEKIAAEVVAGRCAPKSPEDAATRRLQLLREADERTARALSDMSEEARQDAELMLLDPELIDRIVEDIAELGVVGEQELGLAAYAIASSRLLSKPLAAIVQGPSSSGKSFVPGRVAQLIPDEAKVMATDITTNALYYARPGALLHKFVLAGERRRGGDDDHANATRALREILESCELNKMVPIKSTKGGMQTEVIWQPGPIAYIESTTSTSLFDEDANRCLLLGTDETPEQTARIIEAQARAAEGHRSDPTRIIARHHALQRVLKRVSVRIPYASAIANALPTKRQDARRAMPQILAVIQAVALLHQHQRSDAMLEHGDTIDATEADYVVARRLLMGPLGRSLGGAMPECVIRFAERLLKEFGKDEFTSTDVVRVEEIVKTKSKVNEYLGVLSHGGVTECIEPSRGPKPARWKIVGDIPKGGALWLPTIDELEACR